MKQNYRLWMNLFLLGAVIFSYQNCASPELALPPEFPKSVKLTIKNYCPQDGRTFQEVFAYNKSATLKGQGLTPDWDRDGLSDEDERDPVLRNDFKFHLGYADSNGDYYSDFVTHMLGLDESNQTRLVKCDTGYNDTDLDGLTDCEENALKLDPLRADFDNDSIPDGVELRFKLNPNDNYDADLDFDQDKLTNLEEIKINTPIKYTNDKYTKENALEYYSVTSFSESGKECFTLDISNMPIMNVDNGNYIQIMLVERYTETSESSSETLMKIHQINVVIERSIIDNTSITIEKDNFTDQQTIEVALNKDIIVTPPED